MIIKYDTLLDDLLARNVGVITAAEAQDRGVNRPAFGDYVRRRNLEKVSKGIYLDPNVFPDEMALLQMRFPKAVFSHSSALYLHDMADCEPMPFTVTVDSAYNATKLKELGVRIYYVKPQWYALGMSQIDTPNGHKVRVYDKERTMCDLIRRRAGFDASVFRQAVKSYVRLEGKNLSRLSEYAHVMNISEAVHKVMEVAL